MIHEGRRNDPGADSRVNLPDHPPFPKNFEDLPLAEEVKHFLREFNRQQPNLDMNPLGFYAEHLIPVSVLRKQIEDEIGSRVARADQVHPQPFLAGSGRTVHVDQGVGVDRTGVHFFDPGDFELRRGLAARLREAQDRIAADQVRSADPALSQDFFVKLLDRVAESQDKHALDSKQATTEARKALESRIEDQRAERRVYLALAVVSWLVTAFVLVMVAFFR